MTMNPLDTSVLAELSQTTGAEFVAELVQTFLTDAPVMIADLKTAAATDDQDGFRRAAHSIKSNANIFGATALAEVARALELRGLAQGQESAADWQGEVDAAYTQAAAALEAYVNA